MKIILSIFFSIIFQLSCFSQSTLGSFLSINSSEPQSLTVCSQAQSFTLHINNPSAFLIQTPTITVVMPVGMSYQGGSVIGATPLSTSSNTLVFTTTSIATLTNRTITFSGYANCNIISFLAAGNAPSNTIKLDYIVSGNPYYQTLLTGNYTVKQPNLSIISVTNQTYNGTIGGVFTRCITIRNGGFGALSQFTLTNTHGNSIVINSVNVGALTHTTNKETILLTGANFSAIGNGNALFETGEDITICENITINDCIDTHADYKAYWGCDGLECQISTSSGNVVFNNITPNLVFVPNGGSTNAPMNSCFGPGNASPQQLKIYNNGTGIAVTPTININQYPYYENTSIDLSSLTYQFNFNGSITALAVISSTNRGGSTCMPTNKVGEMLLTLPNLNPGDTLYLKWNTYSCCNSNTLCGAGNPVANGWLYSAEYRNICENNYHIAETWGRVYSQIDIDLLNNVNPTYLTDTQVGTFSFQSDNYTFSYPVGPGAHYEVKLTLPPCLSYNGNFQWANALNTSSWTPSSITTNSNIVTAIFPGTVPFNINLGNIYFDLMANCAGCSGNGGSIGIKIVYVPNNSCACAIDVACLNSPPVIVACPGSCPEGIIFEKFTFRRVNFGLPDNLPLLSPGGDGIADGTGSLDFTKIRTDRAMYKDTIMAIYTGAVKTSTTFPNWQNCYISSKIDNGNKITFVRGDFEIYRAGILQAHCINFTPTITIAGASRTYFFDLSVTTLSTCLPAGFIYLNNDSIIFKASYYVSTNIGNAAMLPINPSVNEFYVSHIPFPTNATDKYQCNHLVDGLSIIGYYFANGNINNTLVKSCDETTLTQSYYLSIGQCCSNYGGGNLFPYEYRNWAHVDTLTAIIPIGYEFVSAQIIDYRTKGSNAVQASTNSVTPLSTTSNTLVFDANQIYTSNGGNTELSDDGFHGTLLVKIRPSCLTQQDVSKPITHIWDFAPIPSLTGTGSYTSTISAQHDNIIYDGPDIFLQASLLSVNVPDDTTGWVISITNNSNVTAHNVWVSAPVINGITITKLYDLSTNTIITPTNGIYPLGIVNGGTSKNLLLVATFTSCATDSVIVYSGWNCSGYPSSLGSYPCTTQQIKLKETPLLPNIVTIAEGPSSSVGLCQEATYTVTIKNVQLGTAYNLSLSGVLPPGTSIVNGSSQLSYPTANSFTTVADPTFVSGTIWRWDIYNDNTTINNEGLKGVLTPSNSIVTLVFKIIAGCGYTSGSAIGFNTKAYAACGSPTGDDVSLSSNLSINGATPPYHTQIKLESKFITPCHGNNLMGVNVKNLGGASFQSSDSVYVLLPSGVNFVTGSFLGIHNSPLSGVPNAQVFNGQTYLIWGLPSGVVMNDSTTFTFRYVGDENALNCEISTFKAKTLVKQTLTCLSNSSSCDVSVLTGDTLLDIFTYKSYLAINSVTATSTPTLTTGEVIDIAFNIKNNGEKIDAGNATTISFYYDNDNNGIYSTNDLLIINDVITSVIDSNGVYQYSKTIQSSTITSCGIIAVIDTAANPCSCSSAQILFLPKYENAGKDTFFCSSYTGLIGLPPITNFSYTWSPTTGLSNANISNPSIVLTNTTLSVESHTYIITTSKGFCTTKDTCIIKVEPLPKPQFSSENVCFAAITNFTHTSTTSATSSITSIVWNYGDNTIATGTINTHTYATAGNYTVQLLIVNNKQCRDSIKQSLSVYPKPIASFITNTVCLNNVTTFSNTSTVISPDNLFSYQWDFENNGSVDNTNQNPTYTYTGSTTFTANLIIVSNHNCKDTVSNTVTFYALPTASFVADSSCFNSLTHFQDVSLGNGFSITGYQWDFNSNGIVDNSSLANPTSVLANVGNNLVSYTVTSTPAIGISCHDTVIKNVWVRILPVANYSLTNVCQGLQTSFTDLSSITLGSITQWQWDYTNDGTIDNSSQNTLFTYPASGTYTSLLIATTTHGCKDSLLSIVNVWGHTTPNFGSNPVCFGSVNSFTNNSTTPQNNTGTITSYNWNFGDNSTNSTFNNPTHTYTTASNNTVNTTYTVQLVVNTNHNCKDSISQPITIYSNPTVSFISDSVCLHVASTLQSTSNGNGNLITNHEWDYTNDLIADVSGVSSIAHTFTASGNNIVNYTITTTPVVGLSCKTATFQNVWVNPLPQPAFSFTNNCVNAQPNLFNAYASGISIGTNSVFAWQYGDAQTSSNTTPTTSHVYNASGLYTVSLTVISNKGCDSTITHQVEVYAKPSVLITTSSKVCLGSVTNFTANALPNSGNITSWQWDVNNFIPSIETSGQESSYTFATPGTQTLTLLTITDHFCRDTTRQIVYVNYYPVPQFSIDVPTGCEALCVTFTDQSPSVSAPSQIVEWEWNFGNGVIQTNTNNTSPTMCYDNPSTNQLATYSATLTTKTDSGCLAYISYPNMIHVYPKPLADFSMIPELGNVIEPQVQFTNQSIDYTKWWWAFGDSAPIDSFNLNPKHNYNTLNKNSYTALLIVQNQYGCLDTAFNLVEIGPEFVFYIPNAFSPTSDNINDVFTGMGIGIVEYEMAIFDRWGEQIFKTNDIYKGWNGKKYGNQKDCQQDVYIWKVKLKDVFGKTHNYVGHVTLLR